MAGGPIDIDTKPVALREITGSNLRTVLALRVTDEQRKVYPRSNSYSIAEGHHPPDDDLVWMRAIYAGDDPVGFLMTSEAPDRGEYFLWRLMIDADHQGNGYGSRAVRILIDRIKASSNPKFLMTSHLRGDSDAGSFYQRLGFEYTGEVLEGQDHLMRMDLSLQD
jgi:diamine N-acetyltransferase